MENIEFIPYNEQIDFVVEFSKQLDVKLIENVDIFDDYNIFEFIKGEHNALGTIKNYELKINDSISIDIVQLKSRIDSKVAIYFYLKTTQSNKQFLKFQNINTLKELFTLAKQLSHTNFENLLNN